MSNETKRLVDEGISPELSNILRSARGDVPPRTLDKQDRILAAAAATVSFDAPSKTTGLPWVWRHAWKIGIASVFVFASASMLTRWSPPSDTSAMSGERTENTTSAAAQMAPAAEAPTPSPSDDAQRKGLALAPQAPTSEHVTAPSVSVSDLPSAPHANDGETAGRKPIRNAASLQDELAVVDAARVALAHGDARSTLARVSEYRSRFAAPRFADEADALEVSALVSLGDRTAARSKADRFAAAHPDSPYLQRVRSVVQSAE